MYGRPLRSFALIAALALATASPVTAQAPASLALDVELPPELDAEALRSAIERELAVPVASLEGSSGTHLGISGTSASAVRVAFVRPDGSKVERTVDVSSSGAHANETLALVAANLVVDEAADLLASLRARQPAPAPPPPPAAAADPGPPPPPPPPMAADLPPPGCAPNDLRKLTFGADLLPYVGMSSRHGTSVERQFSFGLFGTASGAVRGFELSSFVNSNAHSFCGLQISGGANLVGGPMQGAQFGFVNWTNGRGDGAQFGLVNGALGLLRGAQFGLVGIVGGDTTGAQFGLANLTGGSLGGAQFGLVNVAGGSVTGGQFSLANVSGDALSGIQAGLANVAASDVTGTQLGLANVSGASTRGLQAGLVNVSAGRVDGAMIGLVNTAEDADVAIGLINVLWKGRTHLDVWGTDFGMFMVGIEHGSRVFHNITGFGIAERDDRVVFGPAFGIGARVLELPFLYLDIDAIAYGMFVHDKTNDEVDDALVAQLRIPVAWRILPEIAVFVSPAVNVGIAEARGNLLADPSSLIGGTRLTEAGANNHVRIWPGFTVGARFF